MANILESVGGSIGQFSWASMGQIVFVLSIFIIILAVFGIIGVFVWWKSFSLKVKIYEPLGQVFLSPEEIDKIRRESKQGDTKTLKEKNLKFDMIKIKRTHGKFVSIKGTPYFKTFVPLKKHEPVPMELMFSDGIHLLKLSREVFIPIHKPNTMINVGSSVSISVTDNNKWIMWNNMQAERVNAKYQDVDLQKRITLYIVIGIVSMVVVGSLILWFIYSSVNKGWDAAEKFNTVAESLVGGNRPV